MDVLSFSGSPSGLEAERVPASASGAAAPRAMADQSDRGHPPASPATASDADEKTFLELRRKVQLSELLSASTVKLLGELKFNGHLTVVIQHGRVIKSGYEEGYFRRNNEFGGVLSRKSG